MYLNYIPLFHSDIWGHVHYGQWIIENQTLPLEDPYMPLVEGVRVVDTAWLSQTILGAAARLGGEQALSNLFAVVVLLTYLVQTRTLYLISGRLGLALAGMGFAFFMGFSRHAIIRPEIFGMLCLSVLLWLVVRIEPWRSRAAAFKTDDVAGRPDVAPRVPIWMWFAIPLLFVFWANAHGSYAVGLIVLACHAVGRLVEVLWRQRSVKALFGDRQFRQWTLLTELALVVCLINPYGIDLLITTATFGGNPNLRDVLEWFPLRLIDLEGIQFAIGIIVLIALYRHSRQRVRGAEVLMLLAFVFLTATTIRMIGWFAPLLTFALMPHFTDIWNRRRAGQLKRDGQLKRGVVTSGTSLDATERNSAKSSGTSGGRPRFALTLVSLLIIWCAFALSPISRTVLGGKPRQRAQLLSRDTPLGVCEFLRENPPEGIVFAPQWWGDWIAWDTDGVDVFMTTNIHLVPQAMWRDYMRVARGRVGWERALDRYRIKTLVAHKDMQKTLTRLVRRSPQWRIIFEDDKGLVAQRTSAP